MASSVPAGPVAARPARSRLPRTQRREHFLDVTAELLTQGGTDAVTMEAVAARAGVSKGLGYAYFANRAGLILALFEREMAAVDHRVATALADATTLEERLRATITAWFDSVAERGELLGVLLQAKLVGGPLEERRRARGTAIQRYWARLVEEELGLRPDTALAAAAILTAGSTGALELWVTRRASRRSLEDTFVRLAMAGLEGLAAATATATATTATTEPE